MEMLWVWSTGLRKAAWWWSCYFRKSIQHHFQVHRYSRWKRPIRSFVHPSCQEKTVVVIGIWSCVSLSRCPLCGVTNMLAADRSCLAASETHPLALLRKQCLRNRGAAGCSFPKDRGNLQAIIFLPPNQACILTEENEERERPDGWQLHASLPSWCLQDKSVFSWCWEGMC